MGKGLTSLLAGAVLAGSVYAAEPSLKTTPMYTADTQTQPHTYQEKIIQKTATLGMQISLTTPTEANLLTPSPLEIYFDAYNETTRHYTMNYLTTNTSMIAFADDQPTNIENIVYDFSYKPRPIRPMNTLQGGPSLSNASAYTADEDFIVTGGIIMLIGIGVMAGAESTDASTVGLVMALGGGALMVAGVVTPDSTGILNKR